MSRSPAPKPPPNPQEAAATRARLIEAAGEVFAAHGFQAATVREICARAGANIAAVNYHFGDKTELYLAVIRESVCAAVADRQSLMASDAPEEELRATIFAMLRKMAANAKRPAWHFRIMAHEMVAPTAVFARVVDEVIGPQYERLRVILSKIIGTAPGHERTRLAANSVIGQLIFYVHGRPVIERLWPGFAMDERTISRIAQHVATFSLCSLREMRSASKRRPQ